MQAILRTIYPFLYLFFCFALPLDKYATAVPNVVLIALVALFPFVVTKADFKKLVKREVLLFAGFVIFISLNSALFHDITKDITIISKILGSLLLLVLFIPINKTENLMKTLVLVVLVCMAISLYHLYFFYMQEGEFNFSFGGDINEILIIDRLYLGFLCVLSVVSSIALIGNKYSDYNKWYFANVVFCIGFVLLISSRAAILLLILLFFLKIFYSKSKKEYILFFGGIIGLVVMAFMFNKNLSERFFYTHSTQQEKGYIELFKQWEPRFVIWNCNYDIAIAENPVAAGLGFYNTRDLLVDCYGEVIDKKDKRAYFQERRFNSHNQFMDVYLSAGLLALLLLVLLFIALLKGQHGYYKTAFLLVIFTFASIECVFQRQLGAYLFALILILMIFPKSDSSAISNEAPTNEEN
ncbi:MAG: O-antigen ligase [Candidatus Latescibacterota bacterium]|jgi:O-antigen ligase